MPIEVNIVGKHVEIEDDDGDDALKVVCIRVDGVDSDRPGVGVYHYFVNAQRVTAEVADVISYQTERGQRFRRIRLMARAEYIREFGT